MFRNVICLQAHDIRTKQSQIAEKQRELTTLEADRKHLREKHREKTRALAQDQEELFDVCENRDYEEVLTEVTNQLVSAQVCFYVLILLVLLMHWELAVSVSIVVIIYFAQNKNNTFKLSNICKTQSCTNWTKGLCRPTNELIMHYQ